MSMCEDLLIAFAAPLVGSYIVNAKSFGYLTITRCYSLGGDEVALGCSLGDDEVIA